MDSTASRPQGRAARRVAAITAVAALALGASLLSATSASAAVVEGDITSATLTWGLSGEAGGGAYFGGCNFLSAGTAGNTGSSRVWTEADGFYSASAGNVTVTKPTSTGTYVAGTWANKCLTPAGTAVSAFSTTSLSGNVVNFSNGTGTVEADGSAVISWTGSFTSAFYGGLTYWSAANPVLTVDADGTAQLTATASGYGASMEDTTKWDAITPRSIVLAELTGVSVDEDGFVSVPSYLGVTVDTGEGTAQTTGAATSGSFPQSFVDFQQLTGQSSYWYSSGGARDAAKPTTALTAAYTVTSAEVPPVEAPADDEQIIDVTVPAVVEPEPATGTFGWTFADTAAASLGTATQVGSTFAATGNLSAIKVTDTRTGGTAPYNWSISGQVSSFVSGANTFSSGFLGWTPAVSNAGTGVTAGASVASTLASGAGLATSATLASSTAAASADISTGLSLVIPDTTPAGDYTATLTVTALS